MDEVYICELCQRKYEPEEINGVRKLKEFKDYTVDLRLGQFRKVVMNNHWIEEDGRLPETMLFINFDSPKGKKLLAQMHEKVTR